jgi:dTMP kinase
MAAANQPKAVIATRGKFITLEGVDGAGKSTHIPWIAERLRANGREVVVTREPGGTPLAEKLRVRVLTEAMDPITETRLMFEARADHVRAVIAPALARAAWVVCDRFTDSTVAYQGAGKGVDRGLIDELAGKAHAGLRPDLTLVFDATYAVSSQRLGASGRQPDRFETEGRDFFDRVRGAYRELAEKEPERVRLIDGTRSADEVKKDIEKILATI